MSETDVRQPHATGHPEDAVARPSPSIRMTAALLIVFLGGLLYLIQIDTEWIRRTGLPSLIIMTIGTGAGIRLAIKHRSALGYFLSAVSVGVTGVFVFYLYVVRLPSPEAAPDVGEPAPGFTLPDHRGESVALRDFRGRGPVLLVFYRGVW
jgi:hypothetical protein